MKFREFIKVRHVGMARVAHLLDGDKWQACFLKTEVYDETNLKC